MAASVIARTAKTNGRVAVCVGSHRFLGHKLVETGFRRYFREYPAEFTLLETLVNLEARRIVDDATLDLLMRYLDLAARTEFSNLLLDYLHLTDRLALCCVAGQHNSWG